MAQVSALERYCQNVVDGKEVACRKVRSTCERLLGWIHEPYRQWHFDIGAAERPVKFIEAFCKVPSGKLGAPLQLEDYEKAWVEAAFGFVDRNGFRRFQEVFITVGRKNGKTSLSAAIELYMLIADREGAPQVYNAANTEEQAKLAFNAAMRMRAQSPDLRKVTRKRTDDLYCESNFGYIKPLSRNTDALDGLDVSFGVMDEVHAMKTREVYDLLRQGMSAREQPMIWEITTNGFTRSGFFDEQYDKCAQWCDGKSEDDRFLCWVYELDDREEWTDPHCWKKANPGLGTVKKLSYLEDKVAEAKENPHSRPSVLTKDFDMPQNASQAWLTYEEAVNTQSYDITELKPRYGVCGFDASDTVDLTSAQMLFMVPGDDHIYEKSMYWIPEDVVLADMRNGRKERDGVPYQQWIERGLMRTVPGNKIDKRVLIEWLKELMADEGLYPFALGYDPWHMVEDYLRDELKSFIGSNRVVEVRQGPKTLSSPMKQIKVDYAANRIVDNHNPINEWCRMNVQVRTDVNFNIQPTKKDNDPRNRIDGWAAEIDAYITLMNMWDDYSAYI